MKKQLQIFLNEVKKKKKFFSYIIRQEKKAYNKKKKNFPYAIANTKKSVYNAFGIKKRRKEREPMNKAFDFVSISQSRVQSSSSRQCWSSCDGIEYDIMPKV